MSWLASKKGTKTTPTGILLRPRVSTRVRISPRREITPTSCPRCRPRFCASSGMHEQDRAREGPVEFGNPQRHRARMPVLQHPPGDEPEVELLVGRFRGGLIWRGHDDRALVRIAVELPARSFLDVRV